MRKGHVPTIVHTSPFLFPEPRYDYRYTISITFRRAARLSNRILTSTKVYPGLREQRELAPDVGRWDHTTLWSFLFNTRQVELFGEDIVA